MLPWCREGRKAGNTGPGAKILVQSVRRRCQKRQEICKYGVKRYNFFAKPTVSNRHVFPTFYLMTGRSEKSAASICKVRQWRGQQPPCLDYIETCSFLPRSGTARALSRLPSELVENSKLNQMVKCFCKQGGILSVREG